MAFIKGIDRDQLAVLPPSLDDYVPEDSLVRVVDAFVDSLDMETLGFSRPKPKETGRPAYDPRSLLKLYIYGYLNRIRSSRLLAKECIRNVEVMFLMGALRPDFRTIADFRKDNVSALKEVFSAFVKLCAKLKLFDGEVLAIDGTKIRAQNSRANTFNKDSLEKKLKNIDEKIARYLEALDGADDDDSDDDDDIDPDAIRAAIDELQTRKDTYEGYQKRISDEGISQILTTDPEAHRMHTRGGFDCCYNIQAAVDSASHLVGGFLVSSSPTDQGQLKPTTEETLSLVDKDTVQVVADKGYESSADIKKCLLSGIIPHVALKYNKHARIINLPYKPVEDTGSLLYSQKEADIAALLHAGILPACYENKGVEIEVQARDTLSCFIRHSDNTVTCPEHKTLTPTKKRKNNTIYKSQEACRECMNRCTESASFKEVSFGPDTDCVPVMVYGLKGQERQQIPDGVRISPNNHNLDRTDFPDKKVRVTIPFDKEKYELRKSTVEHPFGTIKWYNGAHYFLMRGKKKVTAEMALSFLAYNLKRALNIKGFDALMAAIA